MNKGKLCRAKRMDNGEWVYGVYFDGTKITDRTFMIVEYCHDEPDQFSNSRYLSFTGFEVDPSTCGEFIGRNDKNGNKIFTGDILKDKAIIAFFEDLSWEGGGSLLPGYYCEKWFDYGNDGDLDWSNGFGDVEVIGNIFDNPELKTE